MSAKKQKLSLIRYKLKTKRPGELKLVGRKGLKEGEDKKSRLLKRRVRKMENVKAKVNSFRKKVEDKSSEEESEDESKQMSIVVNPW